MFLCAVYDTYTEHNVDSVRVSRGTRGLVFRYRTAEPVTHPPVPGRVLGAKTK